VEDPLFLQLRQRGGDRRAAGGDELGEDAVGERNRDLDPLAAHPPEAVGEVPEEHRQPGLHPPLADDREQHRQVAGAQGAAADQPDTDLREPHAATGEVAIEDRQAGILDHQPVGGGGDARPVADPIPRSQQVARS